MNTGKITASQIMSTRLAVTSPDDHVLDAVELLMTRRVSGLPVVDSANRFCGRFTEQNAIAALDLGQIRPWSFRSEKLRRVCAADVMNSSADLVLHAHQDVFESAGALIKNRVSGAPVIDHDGRLLGVFSEQSVMHVFIGLCWEQLPSSSVTAWLDRDEQRRVSEDTPLDEVLQRFQDTSYRRLMVMRGDQLVGQISRLDALGAAMACSRQPLVEYERPSSADEHHSTKTRVSAWMRRQVESTVPHADVLTIAQQFLRSCCRQMPVLEEGRLLGQISRSDLVRAIQRYFPAHVEQSGEPPTLYLSSTNKSDASSILNR